MAKARSELRPAGARGSAGRLDRLRLALLAVALDVFRLGLFDRLQLVAFGAHAELREAVFLEVRIAERIARGPVRPSHDRAARRIPEEDRRERPVVPRAQPRLAPRFLLAVHRVVAQLL